MSRTWTLALLILGAVLLGAFLGEALRPVEEGSALESEDGDAGRVARLEAEIERLRTAQAIPATAGDAQRLAGRGAGAARDERLAVASHDPGHGADGSARAARTEGNAATTKVGAGDLPPSLGVLDVIRLLESGGVRQADTALVGAAFAERFRPLAEGPTVRGEEMEPEAPLADGTVIVLDEGVHDFSRFSGAHRGDFPADVTFRGIGRDRTLLILHEVSATGEMRNLAFEDLTLDTRGHYLADVRGDEPISLRFDRSRVIGFDAGPGGAVLLAARHGAVLARDTSFEAGFGNAPGTGSFFHVRGPFLVRFERCVVRGPFRSLYEKSDRAAYLYAACRFEQMHPDRRRDLETRDPNVRLEDCVIDYARASEEPTTRRVITELNPDWR